MSTVPRAAPHRVLLALGLAAASAAAIGCGPSLDEHGPVGRIFAGHRVVGRAISEKAYYHYMRADLASLRGDAEGAVNELKFALAFDPQAVELHRRLAEELMQLGRWDEAAAAVDAALRLDRTDAGAWLLAARLRLRRGDPEGALAAYRAAVAGEPDNIEAHLALADHQLSVGDPDAALATLRTLAARLPTSAEAHTRLGRALAATDPTAALGHLERALQLDPGQVNVRVEYAQLLALQGRAEEAVGNMREALERAADRVAVGERLIRLYLDLGRRAAARGVLDLLDDGGTDPRQQLVRATLLRALHDLPAARKEATAALAARPDLHGARLLLGAILEEEKQPQQAVAEYLKIPASAEELVESRRRAAEALRVAGQRDAAVTLLEQALAARPDSDELVEPLAALLARRGQGDRALALLAAHLKRRPASETLQFALATTHELLGQWQQAVAEMRALLRRTPSQASALNFVGYTLAEHGADLAEAERLVRAALAFRPFDGYIRDSLGWIYFRQGRLDDALRTLEIADRLAPGEPEILAHLAAVCLRRNDRRRAAALLDRARNRNPDERVRREIDRLARSLGAAPIP